MGKNAVNIGQNYFHNEDLSEAKILIMKIILTDIHGHYSHNVVKIFLVCTRFHNEKSDITTTQTDQLGTSKRSSKLTWTKADRTESRVGWFTVFNISSMELSWSCGLYYII